MKTILILIFSLSALSLIGQRQYSSAQITTIDATSDASGGDLYHDTTANILYIGLMTGKLVPIQNTDDQDLSLSGNTLSLTNDGTTVNLAPYLDNTDNQDLSLTGNTLSLTNDGTTVDLSPYLDNTDNQDLSLTGNTLSLTNDGTTVDLSAYLDNTDDQTLTYLNTDPNDNINTLQIEGSPVFNIDDNHLGTNNQTLTAARTVSMNGLSLTFDGTQDIIIESDGDLGVGTTTPAAKLDVDNGSVRFSDYGIGTYLENLPSVDSAIHHLAVTANGDVIETNTVKSSKIFYPPAIVIDVSAISTGESIDLYQEYLNRFGSPLLSNPSAPSSIPTYQRSELFYYVTDLDMSVFSNYSLDDNGNFNYDVASVPTNNCTFINVVFVVK